MEKWLVRTEKCAIMGPMSREDLQKSIREGQLGPQDEVCQAGSYWIFLHETEEVQRQLDVVVQRLVFQEGDGENEEETQTEILSMDLAPSGDAEIPDLGESVSEETSVLSNRAFRQIRSRKDAGEVQTRVADLAPDFFQASVKVGPESSSFWRGFAVFLAIFIVGLLVAMVWVLKSPASR